MATIHFPTHRLDCGCVYRGLANSYDLCKSHGAIVKKGEERAKFGQRNTQTGSDPFHKPRDITPKHPQSKQVLNVVNAMRAGLLPLMIEGEMVEWNRCTEVISLAILQLKDEAGYQYDRVGRERVAPGWDGDDDRELWPALSPDQRALAEGMEEFILRLTEVQQETLRLRFWQNLSQRDAGLRLGVSKKSVEVNEQRAKKAMLKAMLEQWPMEGVDGAESEAWTTEGTSYDVLEALGEAPRTEMALSGAAPQA